eukprot:g28964.t1
MPVRGRGVGAWHGRCFGGTSGESLRPATAVPYACDVGAREDAEKLGFREKGVGPATSLEFAEGRRKARCIEGGQGRSEVGCRSAPVVHGYISSDAEQSPSAVSPRRAGGSAERNT